ncbi:MAG: helix-turn-helix domain-containing protein [Candidatus Omnitrophica bacterium]|nr:helix-turn-helix domain-containing protein [Candidatus Omnitrophota bacterium]
MNEEKLLTVREVAVLLNISEKEVMNLAEIGTIPAYKVGGVYLRFKKEQVHDYHKTKRPQTHKTAKAKHNSLQDTISDFLYFNDFYILAIALIVLLLTLIFRG